MKRLSRSKIVSVSVALLAGWFVAALASLSIGNVPIPPGTAVQTLVGHLQGMPSVDTTVEAILLSVRLPRVLLATLVGAALAVAGAAFQALLRNPLADPYVLGVSTGASTGTILYSIWAASALTASGSGPVYGRPVAAFAGAALTVAAVYVISGGTSRAPESSQRLLLAGIVLASFMPPRL